MFDSYKDISIKDGARQLRTGKTRSIRREISSRDLKLPVQWRPFIDLTDNKESLAVFLKNELLYKAPVGDRELVVSGCNDGTAASSAGRNVVHIYSSQEEADAQIVLHASEVKSRGYERIIVKSSDTDVLLLLIAFYPRLSNEVWMKAGTSKTYRYIAVHDVQYQDEVRYTLLAFHAITGCDTTSQLHGISKKAA